MQSSPVQVAEKRPDNLTMLRRKSLGIASGKGGVGKSTVAVNLSVHAAKNRQRVGLVDLDPLSNTSVILDVDEERLSKVSSRLSEPGRPLQSYIFPVLGNLHLIFPRPKLEREDSVRLLELLFVRHAAELAHRYDILIFDMPAGIGHEENLAFIPFFGRMLIVTNAEPTAHVSAGGYLRAALEIDPALKFYFWHNKFSDTPNSGFDPKDVIGNYNAFAPDDLRIPRERVTRAENIAFVPEDASLDMLRVRTSPRAALGFKLLESLTVLEEHFLDQLTLPPGLGKDEANLLKFHASRLERQSAPEEAASEASRYLGGFPGLQAPGADRLVPYFRRLFEHPVRRPIMQARRLLNTAVRSEAPTAGAASADRAQQARGKASSPTTSSPTTASPIRSSPVKSSPFAPAPDRHVVEILRRISTGRNVNDPFTRNLAGIVFYYYCVWKLFESDSVARLVLRFIPLRRNAAGKPVRDRFRQIRYLVQHDAQYHRRYYELLSRLFPLIVRQINQMAAALKLEPVLLRDRAGRIHRNAYLKLTMHFVHDTVNSGLGIYVGLKFNLAATAIQAGADRILRKIADETER